MATKDECGLKTSKQSPLPLSPTSTCFLPTDGGEAHRFPAWCPVAVVGRATSALASYQHFSLVMEALWLTQPLAPISRTLYHADMLIC